MNGYIHRDLKPENILIDDKFHLKIVKDFNLLQCDFSTATCQGKYFDRKEKKFKNGIEPTSEILRISDMIGTAEYISPEMISDGKSYFSSDLWALGVIIYHFFHGSTPFAANSQNQTLQNIVNFKMSPISEVKFLY